MSTENRVPEETIIDVTPAPTAVEETPKVEPETNPEENVSIADAAGDIIEQLPDYSKLNYAELLNRRKDLENQISMTEAMYTSVQSIREFWKGVEDESYMKSAMEELKNSTDGAELKELLENSEKFDEQYAKYMNALQARLESVKANINHRYGDVAKTLTFIDSEAKEAFQNSINRMTEARTRMIKLAEQFPRRGYKPYMADQRIRALQAHIAAIDDRIPMTFWMNKAKEPGAVRRVEKMIRQDFEKSITESLKVVCKISGTDESYGKVFYTSLLGMPASILGIQAHPLAVHLFLAHIAHVYNTRHNSGEDHYAVVMVSTINGLLHKEWDYEQRPEETIANILLWYYKNSSEPTRKMYDKKQWMIDAQTRVRPVIDSITKKEVEKDVNEELHAAVDIPLEEKQEEEAATPETE